VLEDLVVLAVEEMEEILVPLHLVLITLVVVAAAEAIHMYQHKRQTKVVRELLLFDICGNTLSD
jgi:hypothetical protein